MATSGLPGTVLRKKGLVNYDVEMTSSQVRKCHIDELRLRIVSVERSVPIPLSPSSPVTSPQDAEQGNDSPEVPDNPPDDPQSNGDEPASNESELNDEQSSNEPSAEQTPAPRRSNLEHHPVSRY